jgi:hypothetical protein
LNWPELTAELKALGVSALADWNIPDTVDIVNQLSELERVATSEDRDAALEWYRICCGMFCCVEAWSAKRPSWLRPAALEKLMALFQACPTVDFRSYCVLEQAQRRQERQKQIEICRDCAELEVAGQDPPKLVIFDTWLSESELAQPFRTLLPILFSRLLVLSSGHSHEAPSHERFSSVQMRNRRPHETTPEAARNEENTRCELLLQTAPELWSLALTRFHHSVDVMYHMIARFIATFDECKPRRSSTLADLLPSLHSSHK